LKIEWSTLAKAVQGAEAKAKLVQMDIHQYAPTWDRLRAFGQSRVLRSSYIWFLVVPVAARVLAAIQSPLSVLIFNAPLTLYVNLPFSWKAFFFASVALRRTHCGAKQRRSGTINFRASVRFFTQVRNFDALRCKERPWGAPDVIEHP
jgi:hypothetical protein